MRVALFYQSVVSDWNHGNAHFLRGLMRALAERGHEAVCWERAANWSLENLLRVRPDAVAEFERRFPDLSYRPYASPEAALRQAAAESDVLLVHEWNDAELIAAAPAIARERGIPVYFHDTHYRFALDAERRERCGLAAYDGVIAYSRSLADRYAELGITRVHVLHEAADTTVFGPREVAQRDDIVFIGNYGDGDRDEEIETYVFETRAQLRHLRYAVYGVRYPDAVLARMRDGLAIDFRGYVPNADVPEAYSSAKVALHIPRRQYVELLPGTPTIRMFEALASGACLVSLPWPDTDGLFRAGTDYAVARSPAEMRELLEWLCVDPKARERFGAAGRARVLERHTCAHRADELLRILA